MKTNTHFFIISRPFLLRIKMFRTAVVEKIKTHIVCSIFFFFENRAICEITLKHTVEADKSQMTIRHIAIASWIPKATNTFSDYVLLTVFPRWLHERVSVLRHTYSVCLI